MGRPKGAVNKRSAAHDLRTQLAKRGIELDQLYADALRELHPEKRVQLLQSMLPYLFSRLPQGDTTDAAETLARVLKLE